MGRAYDKQVGRALGAPDNADTETTSVASGPLPLVADGDRPEDPAEFASTLGNRKRV